jgi:uncharacterized membrane protein
MSLWKRVFTKRRDGERGATLVLVAICMTALIAASGISVDLGREVDMNRSLQSTADSAAIDAARYMSIIDQDQPAPAAVALTAQAKNGVAESGSNATVTATGGVWEYKNGSWKFDPPQKPCGISVPPAITPCNAVKVTVTSSLSNLFEHGSRTLSRTAVGFQTPEAGFSIGTYLATVSSTQSSVLRSLLSALAASPIPVSGTGSVGVLGYSGLATSYVSIQQLINVSGGVLTPSNVLNTSLTSALLDQFLDNALQLQAGMLTCGSSPQPPPCAAVSALNTLAGDIHGSTSTTLCQLVSINGSGCGTQLAATALNTNIDVLQTLTTEAELANGTNALDVSTALGLPGVVSAKLVLTVGQIPQIAYGPINTTASTGQVNAVLTLNVGTVLAPQMVTLQVTAATGTASLFSVTCKAPFHAQVNANTTAATITPSALGLTFGPTTVSGAIGSPVFTAGFVPPSASTISSPSNQNPQTIGNDSPTIVLGTGSGNTGFSTLLAPIFAGVDTVLAPVLNSLGVTLSGAQVAGLSVNCGAVTLAQ